MKKLWAIMLSVCILITGCSSNGEEKGFFAWMDGYLAMAVGEEFEVALTFFFERGKPPFHIDDVRSLTLGDEVQIEITDYSITPLDSDGTLQYEGYAFKLSLQAMEKGIFKTDKLIAVMDNETVTFTIGEWAFDVEDGITPVEDEEKIDVWSSPVVGSDPDTFVYDYVITDKNVTIKEIWVSEDVILSEAGGLPPSNKVELPQKMEAPINFIRPKIILDIDGEEYITFGMSYYSGAMGIEKEVLEKSKERR